MTAEVEVSLMHLLQQLDLLLPDPEDQTLNHVIARRNFVHGLNNVRLAVGRIEAHAEIMCAAWQQVLKHHQDPFEEAYRAD